MEMIHRILGYVAILVVAIGIAWALAASRSDAFGGQRFARFQVFVVALFTVTALVGITMLIAGEQPKEGLHLVYAGIAVAVLPLTRSFVPGTDRRAGIAAVIAFVVLGFVLYRLFVTA